MNVPLSWLKTYVEIDVPIETLAERLTLAGLEIEQITYIGLPGAELPWDPERIFVGEILAVHPHPNADRLVLAEVNYGGPETETVVTGAPSLLERKGQTDLHLKVAFALEGAQLYDGHTEGWKVRKLKATRIRGVPSRAMVCSEKELGLSDAHEDIIYLPDDAPVGTPLVDYLGDAVLSFDIKGPFGHLQSVYGIAREVAALLDKPLSREPLETLPVTLTEHPPFLELAIEDPDLCPRYTATLIRNVTVGPSPFWMQQRLRLAGMRPINNIVDITNYVMLELGEPLHAFDYARLNPRPGNSLPAIIVRRARPGEQMTTLDGQERIFDDQMLLITDGAGPVAIAGVMGGLESEVTESTRDILLEAANFNFLNVRRTAHTLGLHTESSSRFGRRVDPELALIAACRAAKLMAELAGGTIETTIGDLYPGRPEPVSIAFNLDLSTRILGIEIPKEEQIRILNALEFSVEETDEDTLTVHVPSHRQDVRQPIDLVEEIGRIYGYDRFPSTLICDELPPQRPNLRITGADKVRDLLIACGLDEVITYSLIDIRDEAKLYPEGNPPSPSEYITLRNPLAADRAWLRRTLLPGLLRTARDNLRFLDRVAIFEIGRIYIPQEDADLPQEPRRLAALMIGPREPRSWLAGQDLTPMGYFDLKGVVEALLQGLGLDEQAVWTRGSHPAMHPGRTAQITIDDDLIGHIGELDPRVRAAFDLPNLPVAVLEFDLDTLLAHWGKPRLMTPISSHPPVYEDLAIIVDEEVPAAEVTRTIREAGGKLLRNVALFDLYRGPQIGEGKKSLAFALTYQADDRTLSDQEVARIRKRIIHKLEQTLGATLRG